MPLELSGIAGWGELWRSREGLVVEPQRIAVDEIR